MELCYRNGRGGRVRYGDALAVHEPLVRGWREPEFFGEPPQVMAEQVRGQLIGPL